MDWQLTTYFAGFALAIVLCWNLGRLFWIPMVCDLCLDISLQVFRFPGWVVPWFSVAIGFALFLWVLFLAGAFTRSAFVTLLLAEMVLITEKLWVPMHMAGIGPDFWDAIAISVMDIWWASVLVIVVSMVFKSTILAKARGQYVDILTNPKKRFLLPMGAWSALIVLPQYFSANIPPWLFDARYKIASQVLVWGWVSMELPFFLMYRRIRKRYA